MIWESTFFTHLTPIKFAKLATIATITKQKCKFSIKNQYRLGYHIFTCPGLRHRCKLVPHMLDWLVQPVANEVTWLAGPASEVYCITYFKMYCMCVFFFAMDAKLIFAGKTHVATTAAVFTQSRYSGGPVWVLQMKPAGASCWAVSGCCSRPSTFSFLLAPPSLPPPAMSGSAGSHHWGDSWHVVLTVQLS